MWTLAVTVFASLVPTTETVGRLNAQQQAVAPSAQQTPPAPDADTFLSPSPQPAEAAVTATVEPPETAVAPDDTMSSKDAKAIADALKVAAEKLETTAAKLDATADKLAGKPVEKPLLQGELLGRRGWNGAFLKFAEKEKTAIASFSSPVGNGVWRIRGELTAPLDEQTRIAALTERGHALPFRIKLGVDLDLIQTALNEYLSSNEVNAAMQLCKEYREAVKSDAECPNTREFNEWLHRSGPAEGAFTVRAPHVVPWTLGLDLELGFDRKKVFDNKDVAVKAVEREAHDIKAAFSAKAFPTAWLAIPMQVGAAFENKFKTKSAMRCESFDSADAQITAQACEDALVLDSDSKSQTSMFVDAAVVATIPVTADDDLQPGVELRERLDGLGAESFSRTSVTFFVTPTDKPIMTRFGVGLRFDVALRDEPIEKPTYEEGDAWLTPLLLVGVGL
jgi:hypothetical protein